MGRGLGDQQRRILDKLTEQAGYWVPLHELAHDPGDQNEMAKARSAVRGLERRGLVATTRMADPNRSIDTTTVMAEVGADWTVHYSAAPNARTWFGTWARRVEDDERAKRRDTALPLLKLLEDT